MKVLKNLFPFATSWATAGAATSIATPAGGAFSYASPSKVNNFAIPAGNNVIQVTQDWALTKASVSEGLVAYINSLPPQGENLTHFDLNYNPILSLGNIGAQSVRVIPSASVEPVILRYAYVLYNGNTSSWYKVGGVNPQADSQASGSNISYVPIQNPTPSCPTAAVTYRGRFVVPAKNVVQEPTCGEWFQAIADVEAGLRPRNTVGIALVAMLFPVQVATQNPIASTNLSLDGPILITSPHFRGQRGYGGSPFVPISVQRTDAYSATGTAAF